VYRSKQWFKLQHILSLELLYPFVSSYVCISHHLPCPASRWLYGFFQWELRNNVFLYHLCWFQVDPNTGVSMYESDAIIRYLVDKYGLSQYSVMCLCCGVSFPDTFQSIKYSYIYLREKLPFESVYFIIYKHKRRQGFFLLIKLMLGITMIYDILVELTPQRHLSFAITWKYH